ncbi:MAG: PilT/PilU family type 4a pilus ATPase, partial [Candidatus Hydrogenedentes bacterium]|nr:PilT/PilU family type 4a pilus ATPase [Candidatus Hydrogenedentota bacterium]
GADTTKAVVAMTTTVSYSGLSFITPASLPIRTPLNLSLSIPGAPGDVQVGAIVVRIVSEIPTGEGIEYGAEFTGNIPRETLEKYVRSIDIVPLLQLMQERAASSLHLCAFAPPVFRVQRDLIPEGTVSLPPEKLEELILGILSTQRRRQLIRDKEIDFPLTIPEVGRWRANVHYVRGFIEAVFRSVNTYVPTITELGLPGVVQNLAMSDGGLVIVTGPSGCGKTTTLAAMTGHINRDSRKAILTIEDPVEYVHENANSIVKQREVGTDTHTVFHGLKHAMRQNPDVIVVSEVRDRQVMDVILRAAESGFLVLTTMHMPGVTETIDRIASFFPREERDDALQALGASLRGVVSQRLFHTNAGMTAAVETLVVNDAIRNAIRSGKLDQIQILMSTAPGSISMDVSLRNLIARGLISYETAAPASRDPERLRKLLSEHRS